MLMREIDFLIIGAAKSATTWLQQSLQQDSSVMMPDPELHYFSRHYERGDPWYLSNFKHEPHHKLVGEKSNSYLDTPFAAERIKEKLPHVKLIAQLRNPVDRAYSDYCMLYRRAEVGRNIHEYLDPRNGANGRFLNGGLYCRQLEDFLDRYPRERVLIVFFEDMKANPAGQLDEIGNFLSIKQRVSIPPLGKKVKDKTEPVIDPSLRRLLRPFKPLAVPFRKTEAFKKMRSLIAQEPDYIPLDNDLRRRMMDFYAPETERLGNMLGRNLSEWLEKSQPTQHAMA
jgi:hypothetical protein